MYYGINRFPSEKGFNIISLMNASGHMGRRLSLICYYWAVDYSHEHVVIYTQKTFIMFKQIMYTVSEVRAFAESDMPTAQEKQEKDTRFISHPAQGCLTK